MYGSGYAGSNRAANRRNRSNNTYFGDALCHLRHFSHHISLGKLPLTLILIKCALIDRSLSLAFSHALTNIFVALNNLTKTV
jgi:hypothetical protein